MAKKDNVFAYNPSEDSKIRLYDGQIQYSEKDLNKRGRMFIKQHDGEEEQVIVTRKIFKETLIKRANLMAQNPQGLLHITDDLFVEACSISKIKFELIDD